MIVIIAKIAIALNYLGIFDVNLAGFLFSSFTFLWLVYSAKKKKKYFMHLLNTAILFIAIQLLTTAI